MTAEQDGLDPAKVQAEHAGHHVVDGHCCSCNGHHATYSGPCLPYRFAALALELARDRDSADRHADDWERNATTQAEARERAEALALDLQGKVARGSALADEWRDPEGRGPTLTKRDCASLLDAALADHPEKETDRG